MSCGGLVIDARSCVVDMNASAEAILRRGTLAASGGEAWSREALKGLLARTGGRFRIDHEAWITVQHEQDAPIVLHAIPLDAEASPSNREAHTMLIMVDLRQRPRPTAAVLQRLFDLTPAEARLSIEIASGLTLQEVSSRTGLSSATLRSQLSAVFHKTGTRRQPELVALLARVAILP